MRHVLGENKHCRVGKALADGDRGTQPVVCPTRWHSHVGDHDVGAVAGDPTLQLGRVASLPNDIKAALSEQADQPLAVQRIVLTDRDSHGISARRAVPRPIGLAHVSVPSSAATRSASPRNPLPRPVVAAADTVVGPFDPHCSVRASTRVAGRTASSCCA